MGDRLDWHALRAMFPALEEQLFLNSARLGLGFVEQGMAAARFFADKARGMVGRPEWLAVETDVRARLANLIGVAADEVHFIGSTTEALNLVAAGIAFMPDDEVVVAAGEYPSVDLPWRRRATVRAVPVEDERRRSERLAEAVGPRTRVLCVSHVHNRTGTRVDLDMLAEACRSHGTALVVDGFQAVGAVAVDAGPADAYCSSAYKWLLAGYGVGFVRIAPHLAETLTPAAMGYHNPPPSRDLRYGTIDYPGLYALQAALAMFERFGWDAVFDTIATLGARTRAGLDAIGLPAICDPARCAGIATFRHPDAIRIGHDLAAHGVSVETWEDGYVRLSPHAYNSATDVDRALTCVEEVASRC